VIYNREKFEGIVGKMGRDELKVEHQVMDILNHLSVTLVVNLLLKTLKI
jgi:hypothetical protein